MGTYEIILADDHTMVRQGIKRILEEFGHYRIIAEAANGIDLLNLLKKMQPRMVIVDISMPKLRGLEVAREIKRLYPRIKVLILSMHKNDAYLNHTLAVGADGYLLKEDADKELVTAIETIKRDQIYVSQLFGNLTAELHSLEREPPSFEQDFGQLTSREQQVLQLVAEAKSNKEIGDLLFISVRTVEHHRASIMRKLNFRKTANLFQYAVKEGYLDYAM